MPQISGCFPFTRFLVAAASLIASAPGLQAQIDRDAARFVQAVTRVNDDHVRNPGRTSEEALAKTLPADARSALQRVLQARPSPQLGAALVKCAEACLDLAMIAEFDAARQRLAEVAPDQVRKLGRAVVRPRHIVRGIGDFKEGYLERFADLCDAILAGYDEVFGFAEFSKVPGKKLRFRVHPEPAITRPPHFAPEFPWHSQIDFPVADGAAFRSPTSQGHFLFYGLCHELGHVIAMWGDLAKMEDHHAWAHYTGVAVVAHLVEKHAGQPLLDGIQDVRWRSLDAERKAPGNQTSPSLQNTAGVMALLLALHDSIGPRALGDALNQLDRQNKARRINKVRYYTFADLRQALAATVTDPGKKKAALDLLAAAAQR